LIEETVLTRSERIQQFDRLDKRLSAIGDEIDLITKKVIKPDDSGITRVISEDELQILTTNVSELSLLERKFYREERILANLNFDQRPTRHDAIAEAHRETFRWILSENSCGQDDGSHSFVKWLEEGEGIFWISGKPGCGKSTLMKFVVHHHYTMRNLSTWSGSTRVVLVGHFFWSAGSPIQRSREGLLRTLLYDILAQIPELIPTVCNKRWAEAESKSLKKMPWSLEELQRSLKTLAAQNRFPVRFCIFIDGLDEFTGDSIDICNTLKEVCVSKYIKMCISSRPWNVFESFLGQVPEQKIYIHDLTQADIRNYVESEFKSHSVCSSSAEDDDQLPALISEITNRAQGVFLWVFLVTRLLREGLMNDDSLADLWSRLDNIPTDLESFFKLILESVEPLYHEKQAGSLQLALTANGALRSEIYSFQEGECTSEDYALEQGLRVFSPQERQKLNGPLAKRLNARCKGLLEIRNQKVDFLHRTVRDFLHTGEMTTFLGCRTICHFNANLSILRAHIAWLKSSKFTGYSLYGSSDGSLLFVSRLRQMLDYAREANAQDERCQRLSGQLLDDLELSIQVMVLTGQLLPTKTDQEKPDDSSITTGIQSLFRQVLIEKDLANYISVKISHDPGYFDEIENEPLLLALLTLTVPSEESHGLIEVDVNDRTRAATGSIRTLQVLLQKGKSPNQPFMKHSLRITTPWAEFMALIAPWHCSADFRKPLTKAYEDCFIYALSSGVISVLLRHGADPNVILPNWQPRKPKTSELKENFENYVRIMEFREDYEDSSPTVAVVWIFLGLKCPNLWQHADHYLRDLKTMITAGANFDGLRVGNFLELTKVDEDKTHLFAQNEKHIYTNRKRDSIATHRLVRDSRWGVLCEALRGTTIPREQMFQARILAELAKMDVKKVLPWEDLELTLRNVFPPSLRKIVSQAIG